MAYPTDGGRSRRLRWNWKALDSGGWRVVPGLGLGDGASVELVATPVRFGLTSGRKLLGVDNLGGKLEPSRLLDASPHDGESPPVNKQSH